MRFFFIRTDKSSGWAYAEDLQTLVIRAANCGHVIYEVKDIMDERNGDYPDPFKL